MKQLRLQNHIRLLFTSFRRATGNVMGQDSWVDLDDSDLLAAVDSASCVIASHGTEADPVLNYGNRAALELWEADWDKFTSMPSRLTAEPVERTERERLLKEVTDNGFIDNYSGIRISTSGKRFCIDQAIVWNVLDENGVYHGQAVIFSDWEFL